MAVHDGPPLRQERAGACRVARLQWCVVLVEHEHNRAHLTVLLPDPAGLGGDAATAR
ncbi:hypothetical protein F4561_000551 [Lipingzhangella halophila]|uniref:Uncharacterized protein n=1 Tax=Lipingzhangella halophila TaxID=1783352 RepID=A0A7W7W0L0_9ACTN|nr:hypothetical protein [Lipingzhangella halophila]MBB4929731.1 hypothetical protein [Lipingzhangella halophila]